MSKPEGQCPVFSLPLSMYIQVSSQRCLIFHQTSPGFSNWFMKLWGFQGGTCSAAIAGDDEAYTCQSAPLLHPASTQVATLHLVDIIFYIILDLVKGHLYFNKIMLENHEPRLQDLLMKIFQRWACCTRNYQLSQQYLELQVFKLEYETWRTVLSLSTAVDC